MKKNNNKRIGNTFEKKIARDLSMWMFDDINVLKREPTSGALKTVYCGDIFPMKQISWKQFPFLIECKYGYEQFTPTLINYSIIEKWYLKALAESKQSKDQKIIFLICNFKGRRGILFCTNIELNESVINYKCVLCIKNNGNNEYLFCYLFEDLLKCNFKDIFENIYNF